MSQMDETRVLRGLLVLFLIGLTVALSYFGFTRNIPVIGLFIPLVGIVAWFVGRPAWMFCSILVAQSAQLIIPGAPEFLTVSVIFQILLIGWFLLDVSIQKRSRPFSTKKSDFLLVVFALNLLLIMWVRGAGFALLGGSVYGGTGYLMLILATAFYFVAIRVRLESRHVKVLLWLSLAGAMVPAIVQILNFISPESVQWMLGIVRITVEKDFDEVIAHGGVIRWSSFANVAFALFPIAYVWGKNPKRRILTVGLAVFFMAMTGFRSRLFQLGIMIFLAELFYAKSRMKTLVWMTVVGILGLGVLMLLGPSLPLAVQRAVSFIKFIPIDPEVSIMAQGSSDWRFDLWRDYCIPNVPKYLLIGRGVAHDIAEFSWLQAQWYQGSEFFYYMGNYHSGPFSLLLDTGLLGTISFTLFFFYIIYDSWYVLRRYAVHPNTIAARYYVFLTILMTYRFFGFYLMFGDVRASTFELLVIAAQLRILRKNFLMEPEFGSGVPELKGQAVERLNGVSKLNTSSKPLNRWAGGK